MEVDDGEQLVEGVGVRRAEPLHDFEGLLLVGLLEVPVGRVREEEEARDEEDGEGGGRDGHPVPARHGPQGVGEQRT